MGQPPRHTVPLPAASAATAASPQSAATDDTPLPEASAKTREQKRFDRYDKDRDGAITREEYSPRGVRLTPSSTGMATAS